MGEVLPVEVRALHATAVQGRHPTLQASRSWTPAGTAAPLLWAFHLKTLLGF